LSPSALNEAYRAYFSFYPITFAYTFTFAFAFALPCPTRMTFLEPLSTASMRHIVSSVQRLTVPSSNFPDDLWFGGVRWNGEVEWSGKVDREMITMTVPPSSPHILFLYCTGDSDEVNQQRRNSSNINTTSNTSNNSNITAATRAAPRAARAAKATAVMQQQ
jgi:hypothetical protein